MSMLSAQTFISTELPDPTLPSPYVHPSSPLRYPRHCSATVDKLNQDGNIRDNHHNPGLATPGFNILVNIYSRAPRAELWGAFGTGDVKHAHLPARFWRCLFSAM
ncbi:hypothetical protein BaRGS_00007826 [Batillaria attramentaria]|uniref:Uncharacterized protein n=1 Tax=Batillaria attramentaria TaxID=370345 RepID=A0ABD0LNY0_9CAEN